MFSRLNHSSLYLTFWVSLILISGCTSGDVRLLGGGIAEGRLEICLRNDWGTVCDHMWDSIDAGVVCKQLGLASDGTLSNEKSFMFRVSIMIKWLNFTGAEAFTQASFGEGTGRIWLDGVQCSGSERRLVNCVSNMSGINSCNHSQDAGVRCLRGNELGSWPGIEAKC